VSFFVFKMSEADTAPEPHEDDKDDDTVKTNIAEEPVYVKNAVIVIAVRISFKVSLM